MQVFAEVANGGLLLLLFLIEEAYDVETHVLFWLLCVWQAPST